jgi:type IV pilus assembly protein PilN
MKVRLNLATKPLETHRRFLAASGVIAAIAGLFFLGLGWHVYSVRKANAEFRARQDAIRHEMESLDVQRRELQNFFALPENARVHDRAVFINDFIDARAFNWTQMFMDLERILPPGVHIVSIEPQQAKGHVDVKLKVGAASEDAQVRFLRALEDSHQFTRIALEKSSVPNGGTQGGDAVTFELTAIYARL